MLQHRIEKVEDAINLLMPGLEGMRTECLRIVHLDKGRRVLGLRLHYSDFCNTISFPLRMIVHDALTLNSSSLVLAHNHPSGNATPSIADISATRSLIELLQPLNIKVLDHIIVGKREVSTFSSRNLV